MAPTTSRRAAIQLRDKSPHVTTLGQVVCVRSMRGENEIPPLEGRGNADGDSLLPDAKVNRTPHFLLVISFRNSLFNSSNPEHIPVQSQLQGVH